jgi:hypothetical protein
MLKSYTTTKRFGYSAGRSVQQCLIAKVVVPGYDLLLIGLSRIMNPGRSAEPLLPP